MTVTCVSEPAPREGLPLCVRLVVFEGRAVGLHDRKAGCDCVGYADSFRFALVASRVEGMADCDVTPERAIPLWCLGDPALKLGTDDPAEAEAADERGERWVRTGELDG